MSLIMHHISVFVLIMVMFSMFAPIAYAINASAPYYEKDENTFAEKLLGRLPDSERGIYRALFNALANLTNYITLSGSDAILHRDISPLLVSVKWDESTGEFELSTRSASDNSNMRKGLLTWMDDTVIPADSGLDKFYYSITFNIHVDMPDELQDRRDDIISKLSLIILSPYIVTNNDPEYYRIYRDVSPIEEEGETHLVPEPYMDKYDISSSRGTSVDVYLPDTNLLYIVLVAAKDDESAKALVKLLQVEETGENGEKNMATYLYTTTYAISLDGETGKYVIDIPDRLSFNDLYNKLSTDANLREMFNNAVEIVSKNLDGDAAEGNLIKADVLIEIINNLLESLKSDIENYVREQIQETLVVKEGYSAELVDVEVYMPTVTANSLEDLVVETLLYPAIEIRVDTYVEVVVGETNVDNEYLSFTVNSKRFSQSLDSDDEGVPHAAFMIASKYNEECGYEFSYTRLFLSDILSYYGKRLADASVTPISYNDPVTGELGSFTFKLPDISDVPSTTSTINDLQLPLSSRVFVVTADGAEQTDSLSPNLEVESILGLYLMSDPNMYYATVLDNSIETGCPAYPIYNVLKERHSINNKIYLPIIPHILSSANIPSDQIVIETYLNGINLYSNYIGREDSLLTYYYEYKVNKFLETVEGSFSLWEDKLLDIKMGGTEVPGSKTFSSYYISLSTDSGNYYSYDQGSVAVHLNVYSGDELIDTLEYTISLSIAKIRQEIIVTPLSIELEKFEIHQKRLKLDLTIKFMKAEEASSTVSEILDRAKDITIQGKAYYVPGYAPLWGSGLPTKILSEASFIAGLMGLEEYEEAAAHIGLEIDTRLSLYSGSTDTDLAGYLLKYVAPTYIPIPAVDKLEFSDSEFNIRFNRFAPGEFIGGYVLVDADTGDLGEVLSTADLGATVLGTVFSEKVEIIYSNGVAGVVRLDRDSPGVKLKYAHNEYKVELYSLGFGIGVPKRLGRRLYMFPSAAMIPSSIIYNNDGENNGYRKSVLNDVLKIIGKIGGVGEAIDRVIGDSAKAGTYLQLTPYIPEHRQDGVGSSIGWPYFIITGGSYDRFIVGKNVGEYRPTIRVYLSMVIIVVVKIPLIGIPIPIPVPILWDMKIVDTSEMGREEYERCVTPIIVENVLPLPLASFYEPLVSGEDIHAQLRERGVNYIVATVWYHGDFDDNSNNGYDYTLNPRLLKGPVLLRGPYGQYFYSDEEGFAEGEQSWYSGLGVALIDPDTGNLYGIAPVSSLGLAFQPLKITYSDLMSIDVPLYSGDDYEGKKLHMQPVFMMGSSYVAISKPLEIPVYKLRALTAYVEKGDYNYQFGLYGVVGRKPYGWQKKIIDYLDELSDTISEKFQELVGGIETVRDYGEYVDALFSDGIDEPQDDTSADYLSSKINELKERLADKIGNDVKKLALQIIRYIVEKILEELMAKFAEKLMVKLAAALAPDPTGGILTKILSKIVDSVLDAINNYVDEVLSSLFGDQNDIVKSTIGRYGWIGILKLFYVYLINNLVKRALPMYIEKYIVKPILKSIEKYLYDYFSQYIGYIDTIKEIVHGGKDVLTKAEEIYKYVVGIIDSAKELIASIPHPMLFARAYAVKKNNIIENSYGLLGTETGGSIDMLLPFDVIKYPCDTKYILIMPAMLPVGEGPIIVGEDADDNRLVYYIFNSNPNIKAVIYYLIALSNYIKEVRGSTPLNPETLLDAVEKIYGLIDRLNSYGLILYLNAQQPLVAPYIMEVG